VEIGSVESILKLQPVMRMPQAPDWVAGVTDLRGKVLPVVDLRKRLGLEAREADPNSRIIVVRAGGSAVGMIVDGVSEVLTLPDHAVEPAPALATRLETGFISGVARLDRRLIILLDLPRVLAMGAPGDLPAI